ncbi:non-reducing end alpha-L-arabinofuranosidase family hydrolase [Streptomyces sp. UG1]|uniref:non-reducing end alpha-L-arabinofuranosidase family hydrolase n=1 Tax=Streptomyces sp. UG1 TaxID=3417652 RepID=UPI003CFBB832
MRLKSAIAGLCLLISTFVVAQGNSAHAAAARYEAESAAATCVGTIDANWSGFSGTGFCNTDNAVGAHAQFAVSAATAGTATLGIRFANGGTTARPADVLVDGATVQSVSFEPTGSWSSWTTKTLTVPMSAGDHIIRIRSAAATGLPNIRALKDPSVVYHNGRYHVFATTTNQSGAYSMVYLNFTDWSQANSATQHYLDQTAIGGGYKAAPQVFYFAPQQKWYLVFQTGSNAAYSTTSDISNPRSWSAPKPFYADGMPQIIRDNIGNGYWVDFWVICDSANCYLFSSDANGHLYRSETSLSNFPNGFGNTVIAMQDSARYPLWEAANVYRSASSQYLPIVEAIGSGGKRYFRSWTSPAITGPWTALAVTEASPFAGAANVTFSGTTWTRDISHGEMIRNGIDQTLPISPCGMRYLYQGKDPNAGDPYSLLPWRLGLLTQTNSTC